MKQDLEDIIEGALSALLELRKSADNADLTSDLDAIIKKLELAAEKSRDVLNAINNLEDAFR